MSGGKRTARLLSYFATFSYVRRYSIDYNRRQLITEISEQNNNREKLSSQNKNKQVRKPRHTKKHLHDTTNRTPDERRPHAPCEGDQVRTAQAKKNMTVLVKIKSILPATACAKDDIQQIKTKLNVREKEKHHSEFVIMSKRGGRCNSAEQNFGWQRLDIFIVIDRHATSERPDVILHWFFGRPNEPTRAWTENKNKSHENDAENNTFD